MEDLTTPQGPDEGIKVDPSSSGIPEKAGNGASVTIEIDNLDLNRAASIKERLRIERGRPKESSPRFSCSIYRVPHFLRQYNEKVYDPQVVSIGPFHYEKRKNQLREMEEHKWRYLQDIISENEEGSLERYLAVLRELEEKARKCYSEVIPLDSDSFVEMMLLDACFIIEFSRKRSSQECQDDGIFSLGWLPNAIFADLIMLENQIPFFILHHLCDLIYGEHSLLEMATLLLDGKFNEHSSDIQIQHLLHLLHSTSYGTSPETKKQSSPKQSSPPTAFQKIRCAYIQIQHLLHLLHSTLYGTSPITEEQSPITEEQSSPPTAFQKIRCASKLKEAGIKFRKGSGNHLAIKFHKGVIEIPHTNFSGVFILWFLNLIAFEQCYCPCKKHLTAYIVFMNSLMITGKDVEILFREGIIENGSGSDGDMVSLFNDMVRELTPREQDFYLSEICMKINQYCEGTWPKMRATLVHDYFRNRWAIISFFAALFLLLLTLTQTFFSSFPKFAYGG